MTNSVLTAKDLKGYPEIPWATLLWGYERGYVGWSTVVELAGNHRYRDTDDLVRQLSSVSKSDAFRVGEILRMLVPTLDAQESILARKTWLYLLLRSAYENRQHLQDPLGMVEELYADFEYPPTMSSFVRYMPPENGYRPQEHSAAENERRLFGLWRDYLQSTERELFGRTDRI